MLSVVDQVKHLLPFGVTGTITRIVGLTVSVAGFPAPLGAVCRIHREQGQPIDASVVGFQGDETVILAYGDLDGVRRGNRVTLPERESANDCWDECSMAAAGFSITCRRPPVRTAFRFTANSRRRSNARGSTRRWRRASA